MKIFLLLSLLSSLFSCVDNPLFSENIKNSSSVIPEEKPVKVKDVIKVNKKEVIDYIGSLVFHNNKLVKYEWLNK